MADSHYRRGAEHLHCREQQDRSGFTLTMSTPGGASITQRFSDPRSLAQRRVALERSLTAAGWTAETATRRR
jgi:hypothetical protein